MSETLHFLFASVNLGNFSGLLDLWKCATVKGVDMQYSSRFKMGQDDTAEQNQCLCFRVCPQETFILSPGKAKTGL